jgi:hypothetical protein
MRDGGVGGGYRWAVLTTDGVVVRGCNGWCFIKRRGWEMKRFKVQQLILCKVSVWGYIEADHMGDAMFKALEMGTDRSEYDHEITSDIKILSMKIKEEGEEEP